MASDELVTVYTLKNPSQAEVLRVVLEEEGIPCFLEGEGQAGLTGIFDIEIQVRAADADRARELIQSNEPVETHDDYETDESDELTEPDETAASEE
jgi:hypothetical protein